MRDWDDLRFLLAVQRAGSLTRAATALRVDKATVGRRVASLEDALGIRLVERIGSGLRLTRDAARVAEAAESMEALILDLERSLRESVGIGPVRLTLPAFFARELLIPALPAFRTVNPGVEVQLLTSDAVLDLGRREADVALRNMRPEQLGIVCRRAGSVRYGLYGSSAYLEARGRPEGRSGLAGHHLVAGEHRPTKAPGFDWLGDAGMHVAFRATDVEALADAVRAGVGLSVLPCILGESDPAMERVVAAGDSEQDVWILLPEDLRRVPRVKAVVDWLAEVFRSAQDRLAPGVGEPHPDQD